MHVTFKTMHRFCTMHDSPPPASELRLQICGFAVYQNEIIHVIIGFKHDVSCIVRSGPLGYVSAWGATRLVHWLILVAPSCLRSHNARYIMLKSLIISYMPLTWNNIALFYAYVRDVYQTDQPTIWPRFCIYNLNCMLMITYFTVAWSQKYLYSTNANRVCVTDMFAEMTHDHT